MPKKGSHLKRLAASLPQPVAAKSGDAQNIPNAVIVKNLPDEDWKSKQLQHFLQDEASSLTVQKRGVHKFTGVNHTALVFLEKDISDGALNSAVEKLQSSKFLGHRLELERLTEPSPDRYLILHNYKHPDKAREGLRRCIEDESQDSRGRPVYVVDKCDVDSFFALGYAVAKIITTGVDTEVRLPDHSSSRKHVLSMEPWYVQFHRPLLLRKLADVKMEWQQENDQLKQTILEMKVAEADRTEKAKSEELQRMKRMADDLDKAKSALSGMLASIDLPAHKQPLLTDFAKTWRGCQIMLLENTVLFFGQEEECERAATAFKWQIEALPEYTLKVDRRLLVILHTPKGQGYFKDLLRLHPDCFAVLDGTGIQCAALDDTQLQNLLSNFNRVFVERTCQVPTTLISEAPFGVLKNKLEDTYLVKLVLPQDGSEVVVIHGLAEDGVRAAKEVDKFAYLNNPGKKKFCIPGALEGKACKRWFSKEHDQVLKIIIKNGDISTDETTDKGYQLVFKCRQEMLDQVLVKLNEIKYGIASSHVDLRKEFVLYRDRALVVNGLLSVGKQQFLAVLKQKLKEKHLTGLFDIVVPKHHNLPNLDVQQSTHSTLSLAASPPSAVSTQAQESFVKTWHGCILTVSDMPIEECQTDAALIFIGEDLEMDKTSAGRAFCEAYPTLQKEVEQQILTHRDLKLIVLEPWKVNGKLTLMLAVLKTKTAVKLDIQGLLKEALQYAEDNELSTISMVPLGVGRKYNYDCRLVAEATVDAIYQFDRRFLFLKNIVVSIQSRQTTTVFKQVMSQLFGPMETLQVPDNTTEPTGQEATAGTNYNFRCEIRAALNGPAATVSRSVTQDRCMLDMFVFL